MPAVGGGVESGLLTSMGDLEYFRIPLSITKNRCRGKQQPCVSSLKKKKKKYYYCESLAGNPAFGAATDLIEMRCFQNGACWLGMI